MENLWSAYHPKLVSGVGTMAQCFLCGLVLGQENLHVYLLASFHRLLLATIFLLLDLPTLKLSRKYGKEMYLACSWDILSYLRQICSHCRS